MIPLLLGMNTLMAEPLSLEKSLQLVATQNPEVQLARLQADQVNLERLKVLTNTVSLQASGSWLNFGEPLDSYIIGDGSEDIDCSSFEAFGFGDLCASFSEPLRVRDERIFDVDLFKSPFPSQLCTVSLKDTPQQSICMKSKSWK